MCISYVADEHAFLRKSVGTHEPMSTKTKGDLKKKTPEETTL